MDDDERPEPTNPISARLEDEIRPLIDKSTSNDGYDCCGCSTYDKILDHAIRIVNEEMTSSIEAVT
jgi:hypothetical protein